MEKCFCTAESAFYTCCTFSLAVFCFVLQGSVGDLIGEQSYNLVVEKGKKTGLFACCGGDMVVFVGTALQT